MDKDLDHVANEIQRAILDDARKIYSEKVIDHFLHPRNAGGIGDADGFARIKGPCGDTMYIYLRIDGTRIADAKFMTDGCGTTIACGSVVTDMVKGKEIKEASRIRHSHILEAIGGLPEADAHCAVLAASTLRAAIKNYQMAERSKKKDGREFQKRG
jgi:nitrogen fixation NifU-like protein